MKDITFFLGQLLQKFIPAFKKIEDVLADKTVTPHSKIRAIKWIILELDAEMSDNSKEFIEDFIAKTTLQPREGKVAEELFFARHDFNGLIFFN